MVALGVVEESSQEPRVFLLSYVLKQISQLHQTSIRFLSLAPSLRYPLHYTNEHQWAYFKSDPKGPTLSIFTLSVDCATAYRDEGCVGWRKNLGDGKMAPFIFLPMRQYKKCRCEKSKIKSKIQNKIKHPAGRAVSVEGEIELMFHIWDSSFLHWQRVSDNW